MKYSGSLGALSGVYARFGGAGSWPQEAHKHTPIPVDDGAPSSPASYCRPIDLSAMKLSLLPSSRRPYSRPFGNLLTMAVHN